METQGRLQQVITPHERQRAQARNAMVDVNRRSARGLLLTSGREVLLMRMAFPWLATPIWIAPGGGLEAGESWEDALVRELREETGFVHG